MECPSKWIFVAVIIYSSYCDVFCQNVGPGGNSGIVMVRDNRDCPRPPGNPTSSDMLNSILTVAATNGILPEMIPVLQGQTVTDNIQRFPYSQEIFTKPLSVYPMPGCANTQEPIIISNQPIRSPAPNQNAIVATSLPCGMGYPLNMIPTPPQTISPPALPPFNCISQIAQALPQENYPVCAQNIGAVRPTPIVLQPQCQFNDVNPCNFYNQIAEPIPLPEINTQPLNLPILPPSQILPAINTCSGSLEISPVPPCLSQSTVSTSDGQQLPLNLQINVPAPNAPAPRITVVSANPSNSPVSPPVPCYPDYPVNTPFQYPPQPPIVIGGSSKSSWRNWLPILLVALLSDRGCNDGGGCCCCCSGNGNTGNNIPIPYPIPIPVNNPIINTCQCPYSCGRGCRDDADDEDRKRR